MSKDFDSWNMVKKIVNEVILPEEFFCRPREIWWCSLGINIGVETDGKNDNFERPVLVIKRFNRDMIWVLPITSRSGNERFYYPIKYHNQDRWVILSQIKTISTKRLLRKIEVLDEKQFMEVGCCKGFYCLKKRNPACGGESRSPKALMTEDYQKSIKIASRGWGKLSKLKIKERLYGRPWCLTLL